jgi:alpha-galactosidase
MRRLLLLIPAIALALHLGTSAQRRTLLLETSDVYVIEHEGGEVWTIGSSGIWLTLALDDRDGLRVVDLQSPYTGRWNVGSAAEAPVRLGGWLLSPGTRSLAFESALASEYRGGVRLELSFVSANPPAKVTRSYACYPYSPVIEAWTIYEPLGDRPLDVSEMITYDLTVQPGTVRWMSGLETPIEEGGPFTLQSQDLQPGASLTLGSARRSTERMLPWFMIDADIDAFFGGLMWSGTWQAVLRRTADGMRVTLGPQPFHTDATGAVETPHGFFGVVGGSVDDVSAAVRAFAMRAIRQGRPIPALVTYNTWFAHGTDVTHEAVMAEIDLAADVGIEVVVLDAGWYPNNPEDPWDYTTGLGLWDFDPERFPHGLRALRDYAHDRGVKFGLWVEPERVSLATVDKPYLARQRWLATANGQYFDDPRGAVANSAQICLADPEAWQWVFDRIVEVVDTVQPDYLKWDDNGWANCDRPGHGHGSEDGNFAHIRGLYEMLRHLRDRYPDLIIENCSGGGARLDFGMLEYTDVAWMDDQTAPASRVRHHLESLGTVFPPAYLFSFVIDTEQEPVDPFPGLSYFFRSRMPGTLGVTWRAEEEPEGERDWIRREIGVYKQIRDIVREADSRLLTPQVPIGGGEAWDVLQHRSATTGNTLLFAFAGPDAPEQTVVHPRQLTRAATYEVTSIDLGVIGRASGAVLMDEGLTLRRTDDRTAHIIILKSLGAASTAR